MCLPNLQMAQFEFPIENANNLRKEFCQSNPTKITEVRFKRDSLFNEYESWRCETVFEKNRVSSYSMISESRTYYENYDWEEYEDGLKLVRRDSTCYADTTKVHRYGTNLSKKINHQDTFVLLFNKQGNLVSRIGNGRFGRYIYKYDKHNNIVLFMAFDPENSIVRNKSWNHKYDDKDRIQESKIYSQDELAEYVRIFYEDRQVRNYKITYSKSKPVTLLKNYSYYNNEGQMIKRIEEFSKVGTDKKAKKEFRFNKQEDLIYESGTTLILDELHFAVFRYEYKYDANNNWIERTTYLKQNEEKEFKWFNRNERIIEYN